MSNNQGGGRQRANGLLGSPLIVPIVTGLLALVTGVVLARLNQESTDQKTYLELKVKHADETAKYLAKYVESQRHMKVLCAFREQEIEKDTADQRAGKVTVAQQKRNEEIAEKRLGELLRIAKEERSPARDALYGELGTLKVYFSDKVKAQVNSFEKWDRLQYGANCPRLANGQEWSDQRDALLGEIREEFVRTQGKIFNF
ncbi:MAG: hypothetical protein A3H93_15475 [Rhodocyclales bacterium RIFCSPLOWO2_02_FULL_63_24]|nr:MAG: hypothetical protein A3H93_15475 [Rhodocyclales bacterium RIFCSPLOWO2_02_FULL_63_24]